MNKSMIKVTAITSHDEITSLINAIMPPGYIFIIIGIQYWRLTPKFDKIET